MLLEIMRNPHSNNVSVLFGVVYWYVWTQLIPRWRGYRLEEESRVLDDGTTVTQLVKIPN